MLRQENDAGGEKYDAIQERVHGLEYMQRESAENLTRWEKAH